MPLGSDDTVAAISSATGPAARMIVRLSGPAARRIAGGLGAAVDASHTARRASLRVAGMSVPATVYAFLAPRSYTGEDLLEFHLPGNPLLARLLLDDLTRGGARLAEPGEFTARAYFNGRIDLAAAEGVAATIAAQNEGELRAARQLLSGELARRLRPAMDLLAETLALVEVGIDFVEEDVTFLSPEQVVERLSRADAMLADLVATSARFERLSHETHLVLVGRPNAGKSTLLNALAGHERAVVSPAAGTTRDAVSADVRLRRGIVRIIDVAGLDEDDGPAADDASPEADIARQMRARAVKTLETADAVVLVRDATDARPTLALPRRPDLEVLTKRDLIPDAPPHALVVSAVTGAGLDALRGRLDALAFGDAAERPSLALNARHLNAVAEARDALARAREQAPSAGPELLALELRDALDALGRILGQVTPDDLLGRIFSTFCIGK